MTFSIVARDPATGDLGIAIASKALAVGAVAPFARAGVGAISTQAMPNVAYGPDALARLAAGEDPEAVIAALTAADSMASQRQAGIVDALGRSASWTGSNCMVWAGGRTAPGVAVQGNILTGPEVVDAMLAAWESSTGTFPRRLLSALRAGDQAGGDSRGRQSAALLVRREKGGVGGTDDRWIDLRNRRPYGSRDRARPPAGAPRGPDQPARSREPGPDRLGAREPGQDRDQGRPSPPRATTHPRPAR